MSKDTIYVILNNLSIPDLATCKQLCRSWYLAIKNSIYHDTLLEQAKALTTNQLPDCTNLTNIILYNENLLEYYIELKPDYEYQYAISMALEYNKFHLVDLMLNLGADHKYIDWNDHLFVATCKGNKEMAEYCINKGANNLAECCFAAQLYQHDDLISCFVNENATKAFLNKEYNKFYESL